MKKLLQNPKNVSGLLALLLVGCQTTDNLEQLIQRGKSNTIQQKLNDGLDINASINERGDTLLYHSAKYGRIQSIDHLLKNGAKINKSNNRGLTPLMVSIASGNISTTKYLIEAGAEINTHSKFGLTPLYIACGHVRATNVSSVSPNWDSVVVFIRKETDNHIIQQEQIKLLLKHNVNLKYPSFNAKIPLVNAVGHGYIDIVDILINAGIDVNIKVNKVETTALHEACIIGCEKIAKKLVDAGANINQLSDRGETPLDYALYNSDFGTFESKKRIVKMLIEKGAKQGKKIKQP